MLKQASRILPGSLRQTLRLQYRRARDERNVGRYFSVDQKRFLQHGGMLRMHQKGPLQAAIIKSYHRMEKALALSAPRPGFGQELALQLLQEVSLYLHQFGADLTTLRAVETFEEYLRFNRKYQLEMTDLAVQVSNLRQQHAGFSDVAGGGGTIQIHRDVIHAAAKRDMQAFFDSRYSIRQFDAEPVPVEQIEAAVRMAQKTPSVCNREAGRVFVVCERSKIDRLMRYQNGNRGFGDQADKLLVVAARYDCFLTPGERYQMWIDGGLFAMSLIYALHSLGIGSCCLNWSVDPDTDTAFKREAGIDDDQAIVMLIAVGNIPQQLLVANSARRPLEQVLTYL